MVKYRIVSETTNSMKTRTWFIERKGSFKWFKVKVNEDVITIVKQFTSFDEAELYLFKNYFSIELGGKIYQPSSNEYHFTSFSAGNY
jgi:hypothetical protein